MAGVKSEVPGVLDSSIIIKCTKDEKRKIRILADKKKFRTVSGFVRFLINHFEAKE